MNDDNQTMIVKVNSSKDNIKSSKHVKRRMKSARKMKNSGVITLDYLQTAKNPVEPFIKGLSRNVTDLEGVCVCKTKCNLTQSQNSLKFYVYTEDHKIPYNFEYWLNIRHLQRCILP
jgi:hypothetical protein